MRATIRPMPSAEWILRTRAGIRSSSRALTNIPRRAFSRRLRIGFVSGRARKVSPQKFPEKWMTVAESTWPLRKVPYLLLLLSLLLFGFFPQLLSDKIKPGVEKILTVATPVAKTTVETK